MLSSLSTSACRLLHLCLVVYMSVMFVTSQEFPEFSDEPCILKMTFQKFRLIVSWTLKNQSIVPTHYTFWYTIMSKPRDMKMVESCVNITNPFCDVTDVWEEMFDTYIPRVEGVQGQALVVNCTSSILSTSISYEPPEFRIDGFTDRINVTVKFPPIAPKIYGEEILRYLSLIIKEQSGQIVKTHKPNINGNTTGNFSYVLNNLVPNTNYCVSVYFEPRGLGTGIQSPSKCIHLRPNRESELSESAKISGIIILFLVPLVFLSTLLMLKRIGYICLKNNFPKVLNFRNFKDHIFPSLPSLEAVDTVEVISVNKKKKVWDYNYDDGSDSDDEVALRTSAGGGYTMHGLTGRFLSQASSNTSQEPEMEGSEAEESDPLEAEPEPKLRPTAVPKPSPCQLEHTSGPYERREILCQHSFHVDSSSSSGGSGDRITFNVNLNSVFMRVPDDEELEETRLLEETVDLEEDSDKMEPGVVVATGERTQLQNPSPFSQCLWIEEDAPSDTSDASDLDADCGRDGYIMR